MTLFIENYGLLIHYTTHLHILNHFDDDYNQNFNSLKQKRDSHSKMVASLRYIVIIKFLN